ncbi:ABC transporter substrate-binding protein [Aurantiacibacter poecillastricola]|uniref:ABC transporter substrate-binding protein n=1 Tax=Aurantiacibacter poecillastricola TaxID=3064385 RepID=UPI00273FFA49|nr:ABC transporter substrate-binding protein [Aurantiacibacter sp. 219JJ12-13]MDP5261649.1 ABC transporter substrate-binding protein [Aurantiacibacter sp. 219JJ12-13]
MMLVGCRRADPPSRTETEHPTIVSLNPCADAILAEIAQPGQLLAISHYSHDPEAASMPLDEALAYNATGGTAEEVLALAPDMVVADSFLAPSTRRALEQAGIAVETIGIASSLEDSLSQIEALGKATGNEGRADVLSNRIAESWEAQQWHGERASAVLWQQGGIVAGEGSLAHELLAQAGFASHSAARGLGQGAYLPLEEVLADPPQVVITAGDERAFAHPAMADGVAQYELSSSLLYCGGPTIPRALERLTQIRRAAG